MPVNAINYTIINPIVNYSLFWSLPKPNSTIYLTLLQISLSLKLLMV